MPAAPATQGRARDDAQVDAQADVMDRPTGDPIRVVMFAVAAAACAALLYLPALQFGFVFDDTSLLTAAGEPVALGGSLPYRPLRYASYLVDWSLGGSAAVYHFHNVALHAVVVALTCVLARRLGATALAAFGGALVVALHPMAVESAAYVAGRRDLLCVAFGLASLLAQLGGRARTALALLFCSVAAKESGLVFAAPLAAAMVTLAPAPGGLARRLAPIGAVTAAAALLSYAYGAVGPWLPGSLATGGRVLLHYVAGLAGVRALAPEYPALFEPAAATAASLATMLVAIFAVAAAAAACMAARRGGAARGEALVLAWTSTTVLALAMWAGLHEPGADRHAYLLLPPLGAALSLLLTRVLRSDSRIAWAPATAPRLALAAGGLVLAAAAAHASREQMQIWSSERALWSHAVAQGGASPRAFANLARVEAADGDYVLARRHLASALEAGDDDGLVYASRAALRCAEGRRALAQRDVRRAHRAGAAAGDQEIARELLPEIARDLIGEVARDCDLSLHARMHLQRRPDRPVEASGK
jgi:hypothetical protein